MDEYTLLLTRLSFLFILSYLFSSSFIFITQPWKKDDTKTLRPLRSLVRIFTARADAHNTIAPLPTFKLRLQKINNPRLEKKLVPL